MLRELILAGDFAPGEWLREHVVSARLQTSRTPTRLALQILEQEGLLKFYPNRGFCVEKFTMQEVVDAIEVRGTLEGMAARLAAQRGISADFEKDINDCIQRGNQIVEGKIFNESVLQNWSKMNSKFHELIVAATGNRALTSAVKYNNRVPLVSAGTKFFSSQPDLVRSMVDRAQKDHTDIVDAIISRDASRAEYLMREHGHRSKINKMRLMREAKALGYIESEPGSKLVIG